MKIVVLSRNAEKALLKLPTFVIKKLASWIEDVEKRGIYEVRKCPGYHDEPLKGNRTGQRSIRLNRAYRAIYEIKFNDHIEFISIEEINKHEY